MAVNAVRLLVLAVLPPLPAILLIVTVAAAATTLGDTIWHTTVQTQVPARSLSRVSSYDWMVSLLFFPVGAAVAGPLAEVVGASTALVIFAAVSSVPSLLVLLVPAVRSITRRDGAVEDDAPADAGDLTLADGDARLQPAA
jgi:MFS family permease